MLTNAVTVDAWTFAAGAQSYTISGGAVAFTGAGLTNDAATAQAVTTGLSGSGGVVQAGSGGLTLFAANTYSGGTRIESGTLSVGNSAALGSGSLFFGNGGSLQAAAANLTIGNALSVGANAGATIDSNGMQFTLSGTLDTSVGSLTIIDRSAAKSGRLFLTGQSSAAAVEVMDSALTVASTGTLGGVGLTSSSFTNNGTITNGLTVDSTSTALNFGTIIGPSNSSGLAVSNNGTLYTSGTIAHGILNNGALDASGTINGPIINTGEIIVTGALSGNDDVQNRGGLTVDTGSMSGFGEIGNFSTIQVGQSGSVAAREIFGQIGSYFTTSGTVTTTAGFDNSGTLQIQGVLNGPLHNVGQVEVTGPLVGITDLTQAGGTIDLGGQTVTISALDYSAGSLQNGTLNASDAFRLSGSGTIAANLAGLAGLTKTGSGIVQLSGDNTYTGETVVNGGALAISQNINLGASSTSVTLNNGTTLDFLASMIYTHPTTLNGDPSFDVENGATVIDVAPIGGAGELVKAGAGTLDLTSASSLTGATTAAAGTLLVDGSLAGSSVTVDEGATLGGKGTIGSLAVLSGATVAPGYASPFSTLSVAGPVSFAAGSAYAIRINAPGQTDAIAAVGAVTLSGGTVTVTDASLPSLGTRYTILTAASVSGTFSGLTTTADLAFLNPALSYDAKDVYLGFVSNAVPFPAVGVTRNQVATAGAVESLRYGDTLYGAVLPQTVAGANAAFDALSGVAYASGVSAAYEDARFAQEAVMGRLDAADRGLDRPVSSPFGTLEPDLPSGTRGYATLAKGPAVAAAPLVPAYAAWATGFGDFGQIAGNGNAAKVNRSTGGFVGGVDTQIDGAGLNPWRVGLTVGYTNDSIQVRNRGSSGTIETAFGGLYTGALYGPIDIKFGVFAGGTVTNMDRTVAFPGFMEKEHARYGGDIVQGFGELGYRIVVGQGLVEPVVQGAALHIDQDGFREDMPVAGLTGASRGYDVQTATVGVKGEMRPVVSLPLVTRAFVGWRHAIGDVEPTALLNFTAGGTPFTVAGAPIAQDVVVGHVGLEYRITAAASLGMDYSGQAGHRTTDNALKGSFEVRF